LSFTEDVAAISLTWLATRHPIIAGIIAASCLVLAILALRYLVRAFRRLFQQLRALLHPSSGGLT
jgi:hypothetical protein